MASNLSIQLFTLLALFTVGSLAQASIEQTLLAVLRIEGFTKFAELLEGPGGANVIANANNGLLVYAPTNAALQRLESQGIQRRFDLDDMDFSYNAVPHSGGNKKRSSSSHCSSDVAGPGAVDLMTLLNNPAYVNLPPGQNASIVEKNMPKGALPVVHTGLGDVVKVTGLDIPYDHGIIRPVSGLFTLPRLLSETLPFLGADETLAHLDRTGLINDLDNRTGITFLAPDDRSIPSDLPDDVLDNIFRRHTIVGLPVFTSDLNHGDSYQTLAGTTVTVTVQCGDVFIGGARILAGDAIIKNGVVHTVDKLFEVPVVVTKTQVQTVTETATETTEVRTTVATTETTTETAGTTETTTETVEIATPETTTTTETVTPCLTQSEPESTSSSVYTPSPPPTYTPSTSTTVNTPPPPPTSSSVYTPSPPPTYTPSTPGTTYTPPPPSSEPESTPCTSDSTISTSSIYTPSPPPTYTPSTPGTTYTPPPPSSEPESTPCTSDSTISTSSVYTPPPSYPTWTPPTYSTDSNTSTVSEPESTSSEPTVSTPSSIWYYSSTTLVTSQRTTPIPEPTYDSVVSPPETSEPCTTSASYGGYGGHEGDRDAEWESSHGGRPGGY